MLLNLLVLNEIVQMNSQNAPRPDQHSAEEIKHFESMLQKRSNQCFIRYPDAIAQSLSKKDSK